MTEGPPPPRLPTYSTVMGLRRRPKPERLTPPSNDAFRLRTQPPRGTPGAPATPADTAAYRRSRFPSRRPSRAQRRKRAGFAKGPQSGEQRKPVVTSWKTLLWTEIWTAALYAAPRPDDSQRPLINGTTTGLARKENEAMITPMWPSLNRLPTAGLQLHRTARLIPIFFLSS